MKIESDSVDNCLQDFKQGSSYNSYQIAHKTVSHLRKIVARGKWNNARELMNLVRNEGRKLISLDPSQSAIGNMIRRVLKIIREEYAGLFGNTEDTESQDSLQKLLLSETSHADDYSAFIGDLRSSVIDAIGELIGELETSVDSIAIQSLEHIHSNEVVMTVGKSKTVEMFLKNAAKKRKFHVIVAECAPFYHGQELAIELAKSNIETTVITDSAIFAIMSRINKVIIGTHTVMADGGLKAVSGSHGLALAAKFHSVPLIVCAPMYKFSPKFPYSSSQNIYNKFLSPEDVLKYSQGEIVSKAQVCNPVFDYVPPECVTLYITNVGGNSPSYVYRNLSEFYHPDDHDI